jgi:GET complex subunit GET2
MADPEETPAQRQARIRQQKREAKITGNASERLDKITRLSGRTPEKSKFTLAKLEML